MTGFQGIDISSQSGNRAVDWHQLRQSGRSFVGLRATYGTYPDRLFPVHWEAVKAAGLMRCAYAFVRVDDPRCDEQAQAFIAAVGALGPGDFPPVIDLEGIEARHVAPAMAVWRAARIVAILRQHYGVAPMVYTSERVCREELRNDSGLAELADCPLWLARYIDGSPPVPQAWGGAAEPGNWWVHQYLGDVANVPGLPDRCDLNRFHALARGETGARVRWLQRILGVAEDGDFGETTEGALVRWQAARGLTADGVVGPRTWSRLVWG